MRFAAHAASGAAILQLTNDQTTSTEELGKIIAASGGCR
jgi:hypothetical protein